MANCSIFKHPDSIEKNAIRSPYGDNFFISIIIILFYLLFFDLNTAPTIDF